MDDYYSIYIAYTKSLLSDFQKEKIFDKYPLALHDVTSSEKILELINNGMGTDFFLIHEYEPVGKNILYNCNQGFKYNFNSMIMNDEKDIARFHLVYCSSKHLNFIRDKFPNLDKGKKNYIHLVLKEYDQVDKNMDMELCSIPFENYEEYKYVNDNFIGTFIPTEYTPVFKDHRNEFFELIKRTGKRPSINDCEIFMENATIKEMYDMIGPAHNYSSIDYNFQYLKLENMLKYCKTSKLEWAFILYYALKYKEFAVDHWNYNTLFFNPKTNFFVDACRNRDESFVKNHIKFYENIKIEIYPDDIELIYWLYKMKLNVKVIINEYLYQLKFN